MPWPSHGLLVERITHRLSSSKNSSPGPPRASRKCSSGLSLLPSFSLSLCLICTQFASPVVPCPLCDVWGCRYQDVDEMLAQLERDGDLEAIEELRKFQADMNSLTSGLTGMDM